MQFKIQWDEVRHTQVHAELDAYYARLYGLARDWSLAEPMELSKQGNP